MSSGPNQRGYLPTWAELSRGRAPLVGNSMHRPGERSGPAALGDGAVVEHLCPECGGDYTAAMGALIVVQVCRYCGGRGRLTDDELSRYLWAEHRGA